MLIGEVMNKDVKTIRPDGTAAEAAKVMSEHRIGSLVVIGSDGLLKGLVTERDIMQDVVAEEKIPKDTKVEEIMTKDVKTITPETTLEEAADIMTDNEIKKLPVIHKNHIVGIITASDLIAYEEKLIEKISALLVSPATRNIAKGIGG